MGALIAEFFVRAGWWAIAILGGVLVSAGQFLIPLTPWKMANGAIYVVCLFAVVGGFFVTWREERDARVAAERRTNELEDDRPALVVGVRCESTFLYLDVRNEGAGAEVWTEISDADDALRTVYGVWDELDNSNPRRYIANRAGGTVLLGHPTTVLLARTGQMQPPGDLVWSIPSIVAGERHDSSVWSARDGGGNNRLIVLICSTPDPRHGTVRKTLRLEGDAVVDEDSGERYQLRASERVEFPSNRS